MTYQRGETPDDWEAAARVKGKPSLLTTLQQATGPSRELDARIHAWVNGWAFEQWLGETRYAMFAGSESPGGWITVPAYTSNLQDALELVPEGADDESVEWEIISNGCKFSAEITIIRTWEEPSFFNCGRPNPALALASAAIEARKARCCPCYPGGGG